MAWKIRCEYLLRIPAANTCRGAGKGRKRMNDKRNSGNTLYLECRSGISGDMTVAALLDLGATEENLRRTLAKLPVDGYEIKIQRVRKNGLDVCDFDVILEEEHTYTHGTEHTHAMHGEHEHSHETGAHMHEHGREHAHAHRTWRDIERLLRAADLKPRVLELSLKMFRFVAEAEGRAHGCAPEEVHFHEVGAVDSIVDIVGTAACLEELDVEKVVASDLWEGSGHVRCQHGVLPVPVPAVLAIAEAHGLTLRQTEQQGEMVTPTGAAIAALSEGRHPSRFRVKGVGLGAGKKEFPRANILRAMLIEEEPEGELWLLESNIDDCTGEALGYAMERLLEAGARDAFFTPIYMKKNRPAYKLSVLCDEERIREMDEILFRETTTIGVRRCWVERDTLERRFAEAETPLGTAKVKICTLPGGEETAYPEYESVKDLAGKSGKSYSEVYRLVKEAAEWGLRE